jgi:YD repeat-containing protein
MKIKQFLILLAIFAYSCEKDKNQNCTIVKIVSTYNGNPTSILNYEYDDQGRIKRITDSQGSTTEFQYLKDSIVTLQPNTRSVYYLNNSGYADSSKVRYTVNPNQLALDNKYTYNSDGFLIEERTIFSQFYNGSILKDTSYNRFTIANGNIIKAQYPNSPEILYEYSSQEAKHYLVNLSQLPFLGKSSKNLILKTLYSNGATQSSFTYQFDGDGNVSRSTESFPNASSIRDFTYSCD